MNLKRWIRTLALLVLVSAGPQLAPGQSRDCSDPSRYRTLKSLDERPRLGAEYRQVARFKLASRKAEYRVGDIVYIDSAMLNISKSPRFFLKLLPWALTLTAHNENQAAVQVAPFKIYQLGYSREHYILVDPNGIETGSFQLLIGCRDQARFMDQLSQVMNEKDPRTQGGPDKAIFERNLFVNWGDACLDTDRPGLYTLKAQITNSHLIASACESNTTTAVGALSSSPLTIRIIE